MPPAGVPLALRRRALRAHLLGRPSREQLVERNILPADLGLTDQHAPPLLLPPPHEAVGPSAVPQP